MKLLGRVGRQSQPAVRQPGRFDRPVDGHLVGHREPRRGDHRLLLGPRARIGRHDLRLGQLEGPPAPRPLAVQRPIAGGERQPARLRMEVPQLDQAVDVGDSSSRASRIGSDLSKAACASVRAPYWR